MKVRLRFTGTVLSWTKGRNAQELLMDAVYCTGMYGGNRRGVRYANNPPHVGNPPSVRRYGWSMRQPLKVNFVAFGVKADM